MSPCMRDIIGGSISCSCIWLISYVAFCGIIQIENVVYHEILALFWNHHISPDTDIIEFSDLSEQVLEGA